MNLSTYGDLRFGDAGGLLAWQQAHDTRHRAYRQALALSGTVLNGVPLDGEHDEEWFGRHLRVHHALARTLSTTNPTSLLDVREWKDETAFSDWHRVHTRLHAELDRAMGLLG